MDNLEYHFLTQHTENGVVVLTFTNPTLNADAVTEALTVVNTTENRKIILDCQSVRFLVGGSLCPDQEPFTPLLKLRKQLTDEGGRLILCNVAPEVSEVFRIVRYLQMFEIQPDVKSALVCMNGREETQIAGYSHTQRAPLCLLLYALAAVFLALGWFVQDAPPIPWLFPPIGLLLFVSAASIHHLTVEDRGDVLAICFGPVPLLRRTVRYADIGSVEVGRTLLLDGWGIHISVRDGGWVWNLWGRDCVVVHFRNGGTLRIGTDDAESLAGFLKGKIS